MLTRYSVEVNGLQAAATVEGSGSETDEALVLAPGLCSPELEGFRRSLVELGYTAISFDQPRASYTSWFGDVGELRGKILEQVMTQARLQFGIGRCAVVGHSLGGLDAIKAVQMTDDSDTLSSLDLLASAGFTGESMRKIMKRLGGYGLHEVLQGRGGALKPLLRNGLRNLPQLVAEGYYGQRTNPIDAISAISDEIDTGILQISNDTVFLENIVTPRIQELVDTKKHIRNVVAVLPGHSCHGAPLCSPGDTAAELHRTLGQRR
jgi:pimeloyl-ACP methyl ester carboxylesterase